MFEGQNDKMNEIIDEMGDGHISGSAKNPLREDAFVLSEKEKIDLMFRFIQYIERQIVLFDAIEDAAFPAVNNMEGRGSLRDIKERSDAKNNQEELTDF